MTKTQFKDDERRYARYAPCVCFRFLQTCQYVTYVVLLTCVVYIFFFATSWHRHTWTSVTPDKHHTHPSYRPNSKGFRPSGFGSRMKESHGYRRSRLRNNRIYSGNGFNPWMHKKVNSNMSPLTFVRDKNADEPAFLKMNLRTKGRTSDTARKVFPLKSGRRNKYAGGGMKALGVLPHISTKSPKRLTGILSQTRFPQTGAKMKLANIGKLLTVKERLSLSPQRRTDRGEGGGLKRTKSHGHFEDIETKQPLATSKTKSHVHVKDTGRQQPIATSKTKSHVHVKDTRRQQPLATSKTKSHVHVEDTGRQQPLATLNTKSHVHVEDTGRQQPLATSNTKSHVHADDTETKQPLATSNTKSHVIVEDTGRQQPLATSKTKSHVHADDTGRQQPIAALNTKSHVHVEDTKRKHTLATSKTKSHVHSEETETKQPLVTSKTKSENGQLDTGDFSGQQRNTAMKLNTGAKEDTTDNTGVRNQNTDAFKNIKIQKINKLTPKSVKRKSDKNIFTGQKRDLLKQRNRKRANITKIHPFLSQRNQTKYDLLHDTKVFSKFPDVNSLTSIKGNASDETANAEQTRMDVLKLGGPPERITGPRFVDRIKAQENISHKTIKPKADLAKGLTTLQMRSLRNLGIRRKESLYAGLSEYTLQQARHKGKLHAVDKLAIVKTGSLGMMENLSRLGNKMKLHVTEHKETGGLSEINVHKKTLLVKKSESTNNDRTSSQQRHPDEPRHDKLRGHGDVQGHGYVRGQGHNGARGQGDVRRADVQGHGYVRDQGHDGARSRTGVRVKVRGRDKVRTHEGLLGQDGVRGQDGARGQDGVRGQGYNGVRGHTEGNVDVPSQIAVRGHVGVRGHEGLRGDTASPGHDYAPNQGHAGTKLDQRQQATPTRTGHTGDKNQIKSFKTQEHEG